MGILLLSSPADPSLEERGRRCFALPQHASKQPRAVCKRKMQALGSALLMILFLLCQDGRMWSCEHWVDSVPLTAGHVPSLGFC